MKAESRHENKRKLDWWLIINMVVLISVSVPVSADIIPSDRRTIWQGNVGVPGGIPERTNICASLSPGASASQINSAISNCPSGQVVKLAAGTYNLTSGIVLEKSNVTLRGSVDANGTPTTILNYNNVSGYMLRLGKSSYNYSYSSGDVKNWTAGFAQGTTTLTLNNTTNLFVGQIVVLDQLDDSPEVNKEGCTWCSRDNGARVQKQYARISAINGNNITIEQGLYMPNWSSSLSPQVWYVTPATTVWISFSGMEDLYVEMNNNSPTAIGGYGVAMFNTYGSWLKNIFTRNTYGRAHIYGRNNYRGTIFGCDSRYIQHYTQTSYGFEFWQSSGMLYENNIVSSVAGALHDTAGPSGNVWAYNYTFDMRYDTTPGWQIGGIADHSSHIGMILWEGNQIGAYKSDLMWGTVSRVTFFRNRMTGKDVGGYREFTNSLNAMWVEGNESYINIVGNVLGLNGQHTTLDGSSLTNAIYNFDSTTRSTSLRHGNYDYATDSTRWCDTPGEPGCQGGDASRTIPNSLYLTSAPSWWCAEVPWPPIGPDLSPMVSDIPAKRRFEGLTCTTTGSPPSPPPPSNLPPSPPTIISVE